MSLDGLISRVLETVVAETADIRTTPFLYEDDNFIVGGRATVDGDIIYNGDESRLLNASGTVYALWVERVDGGLQPAPADIERLRVELDDLFDRHIKRTYKY